VLGKSRLRLLPATRAEDDGDADCMLLVREDHCPHQREQLVVEERVEGAFWADQLDRLATLAEEAERA
jgi:hypothetical protein